MAFLSAVVIATLLLVLTHCSYVDRELPELHYHYNHLEPVMDEQTLKVHHQGHFAAYTKKMNEAIKEVEALMPGVLPLESGDLADIARDFINIRKVLQSNRKVDTHLVNKLRNNLGGFLAHDIFFKGLTPAAAKQGDEWFGLAAPLKKALTTSFGHIEDFKDNIIDEATNFYGAGWVWLVMEHRSGELMLLRTLDQDTPYSTGYEPIVALDMWEHAYYLKHKNNQADWIDNWWKLVNWEHASVMFEQADHRRRNVEAINQHEEDEF